MYFKNYTPNNNRIFPGIHAVFLVDVSTVQVLSCCSEIPS